MRAVALILIASLAAGGCRWLKPTDDDDTGGGDEFTEAPVAPTPAGCSGDALDAIAIAFFGQSAATVQVFGASFNVPANSGQSGATPFEIRRAVVPCEYTMTGEVAAGAGTSFTFLRVGERERQPGGVEKGSIVFEQGPLSRGQSDTPECSVDIRALDQSAAQFRLRFRVVASNANACL